MASRPQRRMSMPRTKPSAMTGTAELNAMIERVTPTILGLVADGVPRTKAAIVEALAGRHAEADVTLALVRLAVTGRVEEEGGRYDRRGAGTVGPQGRGAGGPLGRAGEGRRGGGVGATGIGPCTVDRER